MAVHAEAYSARDGGHARTLRLRESRRRQETPAPATSPRRRTYDTHLTRAPYLTDLVGLHVIVNFATDQSGTTASVSYGPFDGTRARSPRAQTARRARRSRSEPSASTSGRPRSRSRARAATATASCSARPTCSAADASPAFTTQAPAGSSQPFSFAVFGDWGLVDANGNNPDQQNLLGTLAASGVRFAVTTGDNGYPSGSQTNYGDLQQVGAAMGAIFGASFWPVPGASVPLFTASGNHGLSGTAHADLTNWPQDRRRRELGRPLRERPLLLRQRHDVDELRERVVRVRRRARALLRAHLGLGRYEPGHGERLRERLRGPLRARHARVPVAARRPPVAPVGPQVRVLALPVLLATTRARAPTRSSRARARSRACSRSTA